MQEVQLTLRGAISAAAVMSAVLSFAAFTGGMDSQTMLAAAAAGAIVGPLTYWRHFGHVNDQIRRASSDGEPVSIRLSTRHVLTTVAIMLGVIGLFIEVSDGALRLDYLLSGYLVIAVLIGTMWFSMDRLRHRGWLGVVASYVIGIAVTVPVILLFAILID